MRGSADDGARRATCLVYVVRRHLILRVHLILRGHAALLSNTPNCQFFLLGPEIMYSSISS